MFSISMLVWNTFQNDARVLKEAQTLARAGHRVTVYALHEPGETKRREELEPRLTVRRVTRSPQHLFGVKTARRQVAAPSSPKNSHAKLVARALSRGLVHAGLVLRLASKRPDVVHAHDVNTLPTAWLAAALSGARLVYDAHEISTDREGYRPVRNLVAGIEKRLMPRADAAITTTTLRAKFFARAYGVPRPLVLANMPRLAEIPRSSRIRDALRLNREWPIVLYQGGIQQGRGLERLAQAAEHVPDAYFVFIGGGRLEPVLRGIVAARGLEERVRFIRTLPLDELPAYTASADVGVQPIENTCLNHYTTDSNKLFEYAMAGLPVIASDLPEISRVVRRHELGLLVTPGDDRSLVDALTRMVRDPDLRRRHAEKARAARAVLNWEAQEGALVELYARLTG